jgi:hypothetical protein
MSRSCSFSHRTAVVNFDDQVRVAIEAQQIDPPARFLPLAKLLVDDQGVRRDHVDVLAEQALQVGAFPHAGGAEGRLSEPADG